MTTDQLYDDIKQNAMLLESDLDSLGWDRPARLYALMPQDDYVAWRLVTEIDGHPIEFLRVAQTMHGPLPQEVMGIALAHEGWTFPVDLVKGMKPEEVRELWEHTRPSDHPDREEIRMVYVVLRDERSVVVSRHRPTNKATLEEPKPGESSGNLVDAMRGMLDLGGPR